MPLFRKEDLLANDPRRKPAEGFEPIKPVPPSQRMGDQPIGSLNPVPWRVRMAAAVRYVHPDITFEQDGSWTINWPDQIPQRQLGYVPSYWEDPKRVAQWHDKLKTTPADFPLPPGMDREQLKIAYDYLRYANNGSPSTAWRFPNADDPIRGFLQNLPEPPHEFKTRAEQKYVPPAQAPQQLEMPRIGTPEYAALPLFQKVLLPIFRAGDVAVSQDYAEHLAQELNLTPDEARELITTVSTGTGTGAVFGSFIGGPGAGTFIGAGAGAFIGGGSSYGRMRAQHLQEEMPHIYGPGAPLHGLAQALQWSAMNVGMVLAWPAQIIENTLGVTAQAVYSAVDPEKYGPLAALGFDPSATWKAGAALYEGVPLTGLTPGGAEPGKSIWIPGQPEPTELPPELQTSDGWEALGIAMRDARQMLLDNPGMTTWEVSAWAADRFGFSALPQDLILNGLLDPLNVAGDQGVIGIKKYAEVTGNTHLALAAEKARKLPKTGPVRTMQVYEAILRTQVPPEKVSHMGAFARWLGGVDKQGNLTITQPETTKLGRVFGLTPRAKAVQIIAVGSDGVKVLLGARDPEVTFPIAAKRLLALASTDGAWAQDTSLKVFDSPDGMLVVIMARDFNAEWLGTQLETYVATEPLRSNLSRVSRLLGQSEAEFLAELERVGAGEMWRRVKERADQGLTPEAVDARQLIEGWQLSEKTLMDLTEAFTGDDTIPWHDEEWKAKLYDAWMEHEAKWTVAHLGVEVEPTVNRLADVMKSAYGLLLLDLNPRYAIANGINNFGTMLVDGNIDVTLMGKEQKWLDRFGVSPLRLAQSFGGAGGLLEGADVVQLRAGNREALLAAGRMADVKALEAVSSAAKGKGGLAVAERWMSNIRRKVGLASKAAGRMERASSIHATTKAMRDWWSTTWRRGEGYRVMPPDLERLLGPDVTATVYGLVDGVMNAAELESALLKQSTRRPPEAFLDDVAADLGRTPAEVRQALTQSGFMDYLNEQLPKVQTAEDLARVFTDWETARRGYVDTLLPSDIDALTGEAAAQAQAGDWFGVLDLWYSVNRKMGDWWTQHVLNMSDMMDQADAMTDPAARNAVIATQMQAATAEWGRMRQLELSAYDGIERGLTRASRRPTGTLDGHLIKALDAKPWSGSIPTDVRAVLDQHGVRIYEVSPENWAKMNRALPAFAMMGEDVIFVVQGAEITPHMVFHELGHRLDMRQGLSARLGLASDAVILELGAAGFGAESVDVAAWRNGLNGERPELSIAGEAVAEAWAKWKLDPTGFAERYPQLAAQFSALGESPVGAGFEGPKGWRDLVVAKNDVKQRFFDKRNRVWHDFRRTKFNSSKERFARYLSILDELEQDYRKLTLEDVQAQAALDQAVVDMIAKHNGDAAERASVMLEEIREQLLGLYEREARVRRVPIELYTGERPTGKNVANKLRALFADDPDFLGRLEPMLRTFELVRGELMPRQIARRVYDMYVQAVKLPAIADYYNLRNDGVREVFTADIPPAERLVAPETGARADIGARPEAEPAKVVEDIKPEAQSTEPIRQRVESAALFELRKQAALRGRIDVTTQDGREINAHLVNWLNSPDGLDLRRQGRPIRRAEELAAEDIGPAMEKLEQRGVYFDALDEQAKQTGMTVEALRALDNWEDPRLGAGTTKARRLAVANGLDDDAAAMMPREQIRDWLQAKREGRPYEVEIPMTPARLHKLYADAFGKEQADLSIFLDRLDAEQRGIPFDQYVRDRYATPGTDAGPEQFQNLGARHPAAIRMAQMYGYTDNPLSATFIMADGSMVNSGGELHVDQVRRATEGMASPARFMADTAAMQVHYTTDLFGKPWLTAIAGRPLTPEQALFLGAQLDAGTNVRLEGMSRDGKPAFSREVLADQNIRNRASDFRQAWDDLDSAVAPTRHRGDPPSGQPTLFQRPEDFGAQQQEWLTYDFVGNKPGAEMTRVVDADGRPKMVFHGTAHSFDAFDPSVSSESNLYGPAPGYFTENPEVAGGVVRMVNRFVYGNTEAELLALPNRTHWAWKEGDRWVTTVEEPVIDWGYAWDRGAVPEAQRAAYRDVIMQDLGPKLQHPGYLSRTEIGYAERILAQFMESGDRNLLRETLGPPPYNVPVSEVTQLAGLEMPRHVVPAYLSIHNPFDVDAVIPAERLTALVEAAKAHDWIGGVLDREAAWAAIDEAVASWGEEATGEHLYRGLETGLFGVLNDRIARPQINRFLQQQGYDGITHTGGKITGLQTGLPEHRVWIPFSERQVKSPYNSGNWSPRDSRILYQMSDAGPVWYSTLERGLKAKMPPRMQPEQLRGFINSLGVKADELKWTGLDDWISEQKGPITKSDVIAYLDDNKVELNEVLYEEGARSMLENDMVDRVREVQRQYLEPEAIEDPDTGETFVPEVDETTDQRVEFELDGRFYDAVGSDWAGHWVLTDTSERFVGEFRDLADVPLAIASDYRRQMHWSEAKGPPRWAEHTLPGGRMQRELMLTWPGIRVHSLEEIRASNPGASDALVRKWWRQQSRWPSFTESHWPEDNVLAHVRFNDRTDVDGKSVLFIEEVQSDWHQQGRDTGYVGKDIALEVERLKAKRSEAETKLAVRRNSDDAYVDLANEYDAKVRARQEINAELDRVARRVRYGESDIIHLMTRALRELSPEEHARRMTAARRELLLTDDPAVVFLREKMVKDGLAPADRPWDTLEIDQLQNTAIWDGHFMPEALRDLAIPTGERMNAPLTLGESWDSYHADKLRVDELSAAYNRADVEARKALGARNELEASWPESRVYQEVDDQLRFMRMDSSYGRTPDAPWSKTWQEMVMRRMTRWAAENGYDRIAWTTGDMQVERNRLSQRVSRLLWREGDRQLMAYDTAGNLILSETRVTDERLNALMGAEVAERLKRAPVEPVKLETTAAYNERLSGEQFLREGLAKTEPWVVTQADTVLGWFREQAEAETFAAEQRARVEHHELKGQDVDIGGQFMRKFYDQMLPSYMSKFGKKWGARVGETRIPQAGALGDSIWIENVPAGGGHTAPVEIVQYHGGYRAFNEAGEQIAYGATIRELGEKINYDLAAVMETEGAAVHSIDITDAMRESVTDEGVPLFQRPATLRDLVEARTNFPEADFWIVRKGTAEAVGKPTRTFSPEHIGVKVTATDVLDPSYLFYAMEFQQMRGYYEPRGSLRLQHIVVNEVLDMPIGRPGEKYQGDAGTPKGSVRFTKDNKAIIDFYETADFSTAVHEKAHVWRRHLTPEQNDVVVAWLKGEGIDVDHFEGRFVGDEAKVTAAEEHFARAFERYWYEGIAPIEALRAVFEAIRKLMLQVYQKLEGSQIDVRLTPEMRALFDDAVARNPELARSLAEEFGYTTAETKAPVAPAPVDTPVGREVGQPDVLRLNVESSEKALAMDLHAWQQLRKQALDEAAAEPDPTLRLAKVDEVDARMKQVADPNWVVSDTHAARIRARAKAEIRGKQGGLPGYIGNGTSAHGPDPNVSYDFRYKLVELEALVSSTDATGKANPDYPQELQPRQRDRAASQAQIQQIAANLNPESLLAPSQRLDDGPPVIGLDGVVESGNGRVAALRLAIELQTFDLYAHALADALAKNEAEYGIARKEIGGMREPVLVRERVSDVDRPEFVRIANESSSLGMSFAEQAASDVARVPLNALTNLIVGETQTIEQALRSRNNKPFVDQFLASLPPNDMAMMLDADGQLSRRGLDRIIAALFSKTYQGDAGVLLARAVFESTDLNIKTMANGLTASLGKMAQAEALIEAGRRPATLSIGDDLAAAVRKLSALREGGMSVDGYLAQGDMFGADLTPFQRQILGDVAQLKSAKALRAILDGYADAVIAQPEIGQEGLFGAVEYPGKAELWERAKRGPQETLFQMPEGSEVGPPDVIPPELLSGELAREGVNNLLPMVNSLRDKMMGPDGYLQDRQLNLGNLPPDGSRMVQDWMVGVKADMAQTKLGAMRWGETMRDFTLLNYNNRRGYSGGAGLIWPYYFWPTETALRWALRFMDRPAYLANLYRLKQKQDMMDAVPGWPSRLAGKMEIGVPFMPEWMGGGVFVDPLANLFPPVMFKKSLDYFTSGMERDRMQAVRVLGDWVDSGEVAENDAKVAAIHGGPLWDKALNQAQAENASSTSDPLDFISAMTGFAPPLEWARQAIKGTPENIYPLPTTRVIKTATAALGIGGPGGVNIEAPIRRALKLPSYEKFEEYRIDRMLATMTADGSVPWQEAQMAQMERSGPAFDEALRRVEQVRLRGTFLNPLYWIGFPGDIFPKGEEAQRALGVEWKKAYEAYANGDTEALDTFLDKFPEYRVRLASFEDPEARMRSFLVDEIWLRYRALDPVNRELVRNQLGTSFYYTFLDKDTRNYENIDLPTLAMWAQALGGTAPKTAETEMDLPVSMQKPEVRVLPPEIAKEINDYREWRNKEHPYWYALQSRYYDLPKGAQRRHFLTMFPQLKTYWDQNRDYLADHPIVKQYQQSYELTDPSGETVGTLKLPEILSNPMLMRQLYGQAFAGVPLSSGALAEMERVWRTEGEPMDDFGAWLQSVMVPLQQGLTPPQMGIQ